MLGGFIFSSIKFTLKKFLFFFRRSYIQALHIFFYFFFRRSYAEPSTHMRRDEGRGRAGGYAGRGYGGRGSPTPPCAPPPQRVSVSEGVFVEDAQHIEVGVRAVGDIVLRQGVSADGGEDEFTAFPD